MDYDSQVLPIEVKAGSTGTLKSLHLFMGTKHLALAVRLNADIPSVGKIDVTDPTGKEVSYTLISLPFYLLGEMHRLLKNFI